MARRGNPGVWGTARGGTGRPRRPAPGYGLPKTKFNPNPFGTNPGAAAPDFFAPLANSAALAGRSTVGGGGSPGGGNPYGGILSEFLNSSKSRFAADSAADAASRDAALRRYIISYGQVPDFNKLGISDSARGFLEKALDPKTRSLAEQNTKEGTSVYARMAHANDVANRRIPAQLAARGMLRSGQTGSDLGEQAQNYKIQGFDTLNEMLGSVEGTVGNFLNAERARADALAQAEFEAQMAAYQNYGGDMYGDPPASPNRISPNASGFYDIRKLGFRPSGSGIDRGRPTRPARPATRVYPSRARRSGNPFHRRGL